MIKRALPTVLIVLALQTPSCTLLTSVSGLSGGGGVGAGPSLREDAGSMQEVDGAVQVDAGSSDEDDGGSGVDAAPASDAAPTVDAGSTTMNPPYGNGHNGVGSITASNTQVNTYLRLAADAPTGASSIAVAGGDVDRR